MSHNLTSIIEEVNLASTNLHKSTRPASASTSSTAQQDDPLAQIVRVLNSHLVQLQGIDAGARELGEKVEAARGEARIAGVGMGVGGGGWVEGFGRAYLGRS